MKEIQLSKDMSALVDDADYDYLSLITWHATEKKEGLFYAQSNRVGLMHRFIMAPMVGHIVDHIDHNTLNNQKSNLRVCKLSHNAMNRMTRNKTGFKGVYSNGRCITAQIKVNDKRIYLGVFKNTKEAASAYNEAATKYYGEYAMINEV